MKRKFVLWILIIAFGLIAIFSAYKLISILTEYRRGEDTYAGLTNFVQVQEDVSQTGEAVEPEEDTGYYIDHQGLREINDDYIGWIHIEGTAVSYPITQAGDNDYYLYRMFDGTYNGAGCVYMDYKNSASWTDQHTIIYGHNMKNGTMFADAVNYRKQEFYDAHPTGILMTPNGNFELQFFSAYSPGVNESAWETEFTSQEFYEDWLQKAKERSVFESDVTPTAEDRVITLSTCTYDHRSDSRFVILAILKPIE